MKRETRSSYQHKLLCVVFWNYEICQFSFSKISVNAKSAISKNSYQKLKQKSYSIVYVLKYFHALHMIEDSFELEDILREGTLERNDRGVSKSRLNDRG